MNLKEMIEKRGDAWDRMAALNELSSTEARSLTAAEETEYRAFEGQVERFSGLIKGAMGGADPSENRTLGTLGRVLGEPASVRGVTGDEGMLAPEQRYADLKRAQGKMGDWDKEGLSLGLTLRGMSTGNWRGAEAEKRAMSESSDLNGGYMLPMPLASFLIDALRAEAVIMAAGAITVPMESETLGIAVATADPVAAWRAELSTITPGTGTTLGRIELIARSLVADVIVSRELLQDAPNVQQVLEAQFRKALSLKLDAAAIAGAGAAQEPKGLREYTAGDGINLVVSAPANGLAFGFDTVLTAINEILADNAPMPTAMIMNPRERISMAKLKDGSGLSLVPPDLIKALKMLHSTQIAITDTYGAASNASRLYLGDFSQMYVGVREEIRIESSPWAAGAGEKHAVLFRCSLRADIQVAHAEAFAVVSGVLPV